MTTYTRPCTSFLQGASSSSKTLRALALLALGTPLCAVAQQSATLPDAPSAIQRTSLVELATESAPASPAFSSSVDESAAEPQTPTLPPLVNGHTSDAAKAAHIAPRHWKYIPAGWTAQPLSVNLKTVTGLQDLYSVSNFGAMFISAGYSHLTNAQPNYGTDKGAFGQRLGAAAIRETTQGVFTDIVFSSLLKEDPRYYQLGPEHGYVRRGLYSITRPLITRKDNGKSGINGALLLGYAASAGLNLAYYPQSNRNFHDAAASWGGSIGGAALGFFVSEFSSDALQALHLKKP